ncbi:MAG: DUF2938 domain-containing protein [Gammaproteobacteria bacterium]|nr:DUF2938 domain-containing protein [Gammaproteobacteria bacterium]MDH5320957.1 DUF2938 domain-containing protein [Gammaproteobacteria bacterium]
MPLFIYSAIIGLGATLFMDLWALLMWYIFGIAASRAPNPVHARLRSLMAHASFAVGLYLGAIVLNHALSPSIY